MNFYGIWISFSDGGNLFYNPQAREFLPHSGGEGNPMPPEYFFSGEENLELHKSIVERMPELDHFPGVKLHLSEIRPSDPDYAGIFNFHNPRGAPPLPR